MSSRAELSIRARNVGVDPASYPNDSKLEQRVIYEEKQSATETGALAVGTLTSDATAPSDGDTVTIGIAGEGQKVYTFKTALTDPAVENEVLIGASAAAALDNLKSAINGSAGAGTTYSTGTDAHSEVTAETNTDTTQVVQAISYNSGETIATTEASTHLSWGAATLASGSPKVVAKVAADNAAISGGARV